MIAFAGIILGIALLIAGGTALVHGASQAAAKMGVSPLIVGLTIVAFGTSVPELFVNVLGAARGETGLAFGNIVGSNIANLALVLGVAALIRPLELHGDLVQREVPLLLLGTTILTVLALDRLFEGQPNRISRADALVLLLIFSVFIYVTTLDIIRGRKKDALVADIKSNPMVVTRPVAGYDWVFVLAGVTLLYAGGELTVWSSVNLAGILGIPMAQVGLFIVAVGTSAPELVTSVIAAGRKESDLAVGNVVGSNIFNALMVLPASAMVHSIDIPPRGVIDLAFSLALAAMLIPVFIFGKARLGRPVGAVVLLAYLSWVLFRLG